MYSRIMMAMFMAGVTQEGKHISWDFFLVAFWARMRMAHLWWMMGGNLHECFSMVSCCGGTSTWEGTGNSKRPRVWQFFHYLNKHASHDVVNGVRPGGNHKYVMGICEWFQKVFHFRSTLCLQSFFGRHPVPEGVQQNYLACILCRLQQMTSNTCIDLKYFPFSKTWGNCSLQ